MSELKVYVKPIKTNMFGKMIIGQSYYLKSEADKVIAHNKYKRCLVMARWCRIHGEFTQSESESLGISQHAVFLEYRRKAMWGNKWRKRWLELAEKFKEAK
jgi:hypothetical protein